MGLNASSEEEGVFVSLFSDASFSRLPGNLSSAVQQLNLKICDGLAKPARNDHSAIQHRLDSELGFEGCSIICTSL
jgi:hypothetical protein